MIRTALVLVALLKVTGCTRESPRAALAAPQPAVTVPAISAADTLDRMDTREPVPLLPMMAQHQKQNMREHLIAVQDIVTALAIEDYAAVEKAASRIGFSEQMGRMCTHMGAGAKGFTEQALGFHRTADQIAAAARERDRGRVLTALGATLQTCTACHARWKQRIVDDAAWQQLSASAPDGSHGQAGSSGFSSHGGHGSEPARR